MLNDYELIIPEVKVVYNTWKTACPQFGNQVDVIQSPPPIPALSFAFHSSSCTHSAMDRKQYVENSRNKPFARFTLCCGLLSSVMKSCDVLPRVWVMPVSGGRPQLMLSAAESHRSPLIYQIQAMAQLYFSTPASLTLSSSVHSLYTIHLGKVSKQMERKDKFILVQKKNRIGLHAWSFHHMHFPRTFWRVLESSHVMTRGANAEQWDVLRDNIYRIFFYNAL